MNKACRSKNLRFLFLLLAILSLLVISWAGFGEDGILAKIVPYTTTTATTTDEVQSTLSTALTQVDTNNSVIADKAINY